MGRMERWEEGSVGRGYMGFPGSSADKEPTCNEGDPSLVPELGRSPGARLGYPL